MSDPVDFLKQLRPAGPWVLTAIVPDGPTTTITALDAKAVDAFVAKYNGKRNIYYSVNPTKRPMTKKAKKEDIKWAEYVPADLDPDDDETPAAAKARYLAAIKRCKPKPTAIVDSGNGLNVLCKLKEPSRDLATVEAASLALTLALGGPPGTQNIDRILRLPGTINLPNAKKRRVGRVKGPSKLLGRFNGATCDLIDFPTQEAKAVATTDNKPTLNIDWAKVELIEGWLEDSSRLHASFSEKGKRIIDSDGGFKTINDNLGTHYPSDSEILLALAGIFHRDGRYSPEETAAALIEELPWNDHIRDTPKLAAKRRAVERAMARALELDEDVERLNDKHAVLPIGGKTRVVTFGELDEFPGRRTIVMTQTLDDFKSLHNKYRHNYADKDGKTKTIGLGTFWINSPDRQQYDGGMAFMPQRNEKVVGDRLNLWDGFGVKPRKPEGKSGAAGCQKFLNFARDVICSGDLEHFDYLMKRETIIVQKRIRTEIALALRTTGEGAGKGRYEHHMRHLLGNHAMQITNPRHLIGNFNPHLESLLRITADEALFANNMEHRNALFGLITEPKLTIEPKNCGIYPAPNFLNIGITSNQEHFIPVSGTARRFFVPNVSEKRIGDLAYFDEIESQMVNDGGYSALLYHLLNEIDLRDFDVRKVPRTATLAEQAAYGRKGVDGLIERVCNDGRVPCADPHWSDFTVTTGEENGRGFYSFVDQHKDRSLSSRGGLGVQRRLAKDWGCLTGQQRRHPDTGERLRGFQWPELGELRARFEKRFGPQQWINPLMTTWPTVNDEGIEAQDVEDML
jgi:hypothetical protein